MDEAIKRAQRISIHASRVGGDDSFSCGFARKCNFNPRLPSGRRPIIVRIHSEIIIISIHASRVGGDVLIAYCNCRL